MARERRARRLRARIAVALAAVCLLSSGVAALLGAWTPAYAAGQAPSFTATPTSPSNSLNPSWSFTQPATPVECELLDPSNTAIFGWATCSSPFTFDLTGHPDGTYTFYAATGPMSGTPLVPAANDTSVASTYTLDTVPPAAPTITSSPTTPGKTTSPQWAFTVTADTVTATCQVLNSALVAVIAPVTCTSPYTATLSGLPNDTYTFSVTATDAAGNVSSAATSTYDMLATPPPAPTITSSPASPGNSTSPQWAFSLPSGTTGTCSVANSSKVVVIAAATCASPYKANLSGLPNDTYTFSVTATDLAGNVSPAATSSYQLSIVAVAAPTITSSPSTPGNSTSPQWAFSLPSGTTGTCQVANSSKVVVIATATCASPYKANLSGLPDDTYTFSVTATDVAGNVSPAATSAYQLLTTPPPAPTITTSPASPGNSTSPTWAFSTPTGTTTTCQVTNSSAKVIVAQTACSGKFTANLTGQVDGTYTLTVVATDAAGNASVPATSTYQLLTTAPAAPTITTAPASPGNSTSPQWAFSLPTGTTGTCWVTDSAGKTVIAAASCASPYKANLSGLPDDTYTFSVTATDAAGNVSGAATSTYQLLTTPPPAPTITSSPTSPGYSPSPTWKFTTPPGTTATCQVTDSKSKVVVAQTACSGSFTANLAGQPLDTYTLTVVATDAAGNASVPAASAYQLAAAPQPAPAPPSAPTITSGPSSGSATTLAWTFTAPPGTTTTCQLTGPGGAVVSAWGPCGSPATFDVGGLPGGYTLSVVATDSTGQTSPVVTDSFTVAKPASGPTTPPTTAPPSTTPPTNTPPTTVPSAPPTTAGPTASPTTPPTTDAPAPAPPATAAPVTTVPATQPAPAPSPPVATTIAAAPATTAPVPAPTPVSHPAARPSGSGDLDVIVRRAAVAISEGTGVTFLLWLLLIAFLAVQDRIDRNDPKLALAPVYAEPDLPFVVPPRPGDEYL